MDRPEKARERRDKFVAALGDEKPIRGQTASGSFVSKSEVAEAGNVLTFKITTEGTDRYGDVVVASGMDNAAYRKNPVVLYGHDYFGTPVGRSLREEVKGDYVESDAQIYSAEETGDGFGDFLVGMYQAGYMNAVSIGFMPRAWERIMEADPDSKEGKERWTGGYRFTDWELLEYSLVSVPANADALQNAADGLLKVAEEMGMTGDENSDGMRRLFAASCLARRYPELLDEDGLRKMIVRTVEEAGLIAGNAGGIEEEAEKEVKLLEALDVLGSIDDNLRA